MQINKSMLRIAILLTSMVMMGSIFMSPVMGEIIQRFPQYKPSTVQMMMTIPNLVVVVISLMFGRLEAMFDKRTLCVSATGCVAVVAVGLFFLHTSLPVMFLLSASYGIGIGIICNITVVMISLYYEGQEESSLMGLQSSFNTIGAMAMNIVGGMLAGIAWYYDFLTPLIVLPAIVLCVLYVPAQKSLRKPEEKVSVPKEVYLFYVAALLFGMLFNSLPANMALLVEEKLLGGPSFSGLATATFMGGGILGGLIYSYVEKLLGDRAGALAYINLGIGMIFMAVGSGSLLFLLGAFWGGCSISLLMPQFMFTISHRTEAKVTPTALGYLTVAINLGSFFAPQIFAHIPATSIAMGFHRAGLIALALGAFFFVILKGPQKLN